MKFRSFRTTLAGVILLAITGCIQVDYIGQSFPENPPGTMIVFFGEDRNIPADTYRMIGQVRLSANDGTTENDFRDKLNDVALENGADAVKIIGYERVVSDSNVYQAGARSEYEPASAERSGNDVFINSFGEPLPEHKTRVTRYRVVVDAELFVLTQRYNTEMALRRQERLDETDAKLTQAEAERAEARTQALQALQEREAEREQKAAAEASSEEPPQPDLADAPTAE